VTSLASPLDRGKSPTKGCSQCSTYGKVECVNLTCSPPSVSYSLLSLDLVSSPHSFSSPPLALFNPPLTRSHPVPSHSSILPSTLSLSCPTAFSTVQVHYLGPSLRPSSVQQTHARTGLAKQLALLVLGLAFQQAIVSAVRPEDVDE
jgi:hypothetical protein